MAVLSHQYPLAQNWLTAKLVGLLVYILCGTMAPAGLDKSGERCLVRGCRPVFCLHRFGRAYAQSARFFSLKPIAVAVIK